jgi:hypothetical protein
VGPLLKHPAVRQRWLPGLHPNPARRLDCTQVRHSLSYLVFDQMLRMILFCWWKVTS